MPEWIFEWKSDLIFMIRRKYYKKYYHLWKYLSCHGTLGRYSHRIYHIEPNLQISPSVLSGRSYKFCRKYHHYWLLPLLMYFIDNPNWCYLLSSSSSPPTFTALFSCNKFISVSFIETFALSWEIVRGSFLKISPMDNSYFKNKYSKDEVSFVEITQIKLQKMRKNVAMAGFCCLASNIWGKKYMLL